MEGEPDSPLGKGLLKAEDRHGNTLGKAADELFKATGDEPLLEKPDPEDQWEEGGRNIWQRNIMLAVGIIAILGLIAFAITSDKKSKKTSGTETAEPAAIPPLNFMEKAGPEEVTEMTELILRGFMDAPDIMEASRYILDGDRKIEQLRDYLNRPNHKMPEGFGKIIKAMPLAFGGYPLQSVIASDANGKRGWTFILAPTENGLLIDWEATVAFGEMAWGEFIKKRPSNPILMRVYLIRALHGPGLPDEKTHDFYRVESRREKVWIPGFVKGDSSIAASLREAVPPEGSQPVTVRLQWNDRKEAIEIVELVHNYWLNLAQYHHRLGKN